MTTVPPPTTAPGEAGCLLIVTGFWPTRANPISGMFVVQQAKAFARAGYRVILMLPRAWLLDADEPLSPGALGLDTRGVHVVHAPYFRFPNPLLSMPWVLRVQSWIEGTALRRQIHRSLPHVHFSGCVIHGERLHGLCYPYWKKSVAAPAVMVIHGVDPFWARARNAERARDLFRSASAELASVVLVGSPLRTHAKFLGIPDDSVVVVPNGTELPTSAPAAVAPQCSRPVRVMSISNLMPLKGIDDNLRALHKLREEQPELDWEYLIVGDGPQRADLERLVGHLGLGDRVRLLGRLPYECTMAELENADVFSLPSWAEAFGIVYLEAMCRGKPVIGCQGNGPADIVADCVDGYLVPPRQYPRLAEVLALLIADAPLRHRLGERARRTATRFTWDANIHKLAQLLR
jgi:glycosyltransferase involved in cell wall biosynthesis